MNDAERTELTRAIAESDIAGCSLENADIDALIDLFEGWLETRATTAPADAALNLCPDCAHDDQSAPLRGCSEQNPDCSSYCNCKNAFHYGAPADAAGEPQTCIWKYDPDGYWKTACGQDFQLSNDYGLNENGFHYCYSCGKNLREVHDLIER